MGPVAQDDLVDEIARELQSEGTCVRVVRSIPAQRAIDVSWAGKRAGRMIGRHVHTSVTQLSPQPESDVAVVVSIDSEHTEV
jgi:hypothetical protein